MIMHFRFAASRPSGLTRLSRQIAEANQIDLPLIVARRQLE
jgi:hypothetical protein